jgi:hypothetical protein
MNSPNSSHKPAMAQNPWKPGIIARMPWLPLGGFLVSIVGLAASAAILVYSDGKPIADWAFQPPTYLAIATVITNICLFYVLKEGANIAWWHTAARSTTIGNLHRHWLYGSSFQDALLAGKHTNPVAVACIIATIAQINSPLLQRASRVVVESLVDQAQLKLQLATAVPTDFFTGYVSGRAYGVSLFSEPFGQVVQDWNNNATIPLQNSGCTGTCTSEVEGLGLALNCSSYSIPYDLIPQLDNTSTIEVGPGTAVDGIDAFESHFQWSVAAPSNLSLGVAYKPSMSCSGSLVIQNCSLYAANVRYKVLIDGNASTITLDPHTDIFDDHVLDVFNLPIYNRQGPTSFGGYWLALQNKFASALHLRFVAAVGYESRTQGNLATQYAVVNGTRSDNDSYAIGSSCDLYFRDPMAEMLAGARNLMFRMALAAVNGTTPAQAVTAQQSETRAVFRTSYPYLAGALGITVVALLMAASLYRGYSRLGRAMTMSPVEVAKAFDAPLLRGADSNAEIKGLIKVAGGKGVMYGVEAEEGGLSEEILLHKPGEGQVQERKRASARASEASVGSSGKLVMGGADEVRPPIKGESFDG